MHSVLWWRDFIFQDGFVTVKKTGARLPIEFDLIGDVLTWLAFYIVMEFWRLKTNFRNGPKIWFTPDRPRPWYLVWPVLCAAGMKITKQASQADAVFHFDDSTTSASIETPSHQRQINMNCHSIEKSHVADVFAQCFGYSLRVDPATCQGPMVEKSEINGAHDGQIITGPCPAKPGFVYQKLIDNSTMDGNVEDIRCLTAGGTIPLIIFKRRPLEARFQNMNTDVEIAEPADVLSPDEQNKLMLFTQKMNLDWGGLDVLRDKTDGRIYVVDVNKTDMGPPIVMPLKDKIKVTQRMAAAFLDCFNTDCFKPESPR